MSGARTIVTRQRHGSLQDREPSSRLQERTTPIIPSHAVLGDRAEKQINGAIPMEPLGVINDLAKAARRQNQVL
jgi:hypothetical protein